MASPDGFGQYARSGQIICALPNYHAIASKSNQCNVQDVVEHWMQQEAIHAFAARPLQFCICIARFTNDDDGSTRKVRTPMSCSEHEILMPCFSDGNDLQCFRQAYMIVGAIAHFGNEPLQGHYLSSLHDPHTAQWYITDDRTKPVNAKTADMDQLRCNVYLLWLVSAQQ